MRRICCNEEVCIGCRICVVWCQVEHSRSKNIIKSFLYEKERAIPRVLVEERGPVSFALQCRHCEEPDCVYACISGALYKKREVVVHDARRMRTAVEDVYACGDCAEIYDFVHVDFRLIPLWAMAYVGGRVAGFSMCDVEKEYRWGTSMNSMHFLELPVIAAGISAEDDQGGYEVLKEVEEEKKIYRKIVLRDGRVVGMILINKIDRAGIFLGLMRTGIDVSSFKEELLSADFGLISLPDAVRGAMMR